MARAEVSSEQGSRIALGPDGLTFLNEAEGLGVVDLGLCVTLEGVDHRVAWEQFETTADGVAARGRAGDGSLTCWTEVAMAAGLDAITVRHTLVNDSAGEVTVTGAATGQFADSACVRLGRIHMYDGRYCHNDNVRTERFPQFQPEYPYVRMLPVEPVVLGVGEDQPVPGLYLTDRRYRRGLVVAQTSQDRTIPVWEFRRAAGALHGGLFAEYRMRHEFPQSRGWILAAGESVALDETFYQLVRDRHPQDAFVDYVELLSRRLPLRGKDTPLLRTALYCSWNYGRFAEQYEDKLLVTARFIAESLPNIKYFLMDAGYQRKSKVKGLNHAHLSGFYPDPRANVDAGKFPHGIRHYSDELRKLGLHPGIWWSPMVVAESPLAVEHPDWLLRDGDGRAVRVGSCTYLDLTVDAAREWVDEVLGVVLGEWKMDALKMDFWSQGFELRAGRVARPGATSLDARTALFEIIRKHLPADGGVLMTCVAVGCGNPFIAAHADTYRNSQDVGGGAWNEQIHACEWSLPTLGLEGRKTFLLNADGIGVNLKCPDNENFFRLTWGYITMGMLEIDGYLEALPERYVRALGKLTDRCDRGYRCLCPDERAFTGVPLPECLYVDFPAGSPTRQAGVRQSVALLNWTDERKVISVARKRLGHAGAVRAVDFWTEEQQTLDGEFFTRTLEGRSAMLLDVLE